MPLYLVRTFASVNMRLENLDWVRKDINKPSHPPSFYFSNNMSEYQNSITRMAQGWEFFNQINLHADFSYDDSNRQKNNTLQRQTSRLKKKKKQIVEGDKAGEEKKVILAKNLSN